jgi:hypothetical protein
VKCSFGTRGNMYLISYLLLNDGSICKKWDQNKENSVQAGVFFLGSITV